MSEIKKGDQVQLRSGRPIMTVQELGDYSMSGGAGEGAFCVWFDGNKPMEKVFDRAVLERFQDTDY